MCDDKHYIGVDIGGTKCSVTLGKTEVNEFSSIRIVDKEKFMTEYTSTADATISKIISLIAEIVNRRGIYNSSISAIGISCGGPLNYKEGIINNPPNLIGWNNVPIVSILEQKFQIPVYLQNDANACALAEWKFGAGQNCDNMVFLTFGTGMGAGLILNRKIYHGFNDLAGEIGHVRASDFGPAGYGKTGSFEGFCSGNGIAQIAKTVLRRHLQLGESPDWLSNNNLINSITTKEVAKAALSGDPIAQEIFDISSKYFGKMISIIIDLLNPDVIVGGSIFTRCYNLIWPKAKKVVETESLSSSYNHCKVLPSALGDDIGDYAAIVVGIENMNKF